MIRNHTKGNSGLVASTVRVKTTVHVGTGALARPAELRSERFCRALLGRADEGVRPYMFIAGSCELCGPLNQRRKQVRLIIRDHSPQHCRQPLQPRTRINRRLGQRI